MSSRRLLLLGPPGAGKGTQAQKLMEERGIPQVSTGEMLRAAVAAETEIGREAKSYMDRGELVPDAVVIGVAGERLRQPDVAGGFILDGFPRTEGQAEALDALLEKLGIRLDRVLSFSVDEESLVQRLIKRAGVEGRSDDTLETVQHRMQVYRRQTEPLIEYYRGTGVLLEIDGAGSIEEVAKRIQEALAAI